MISRFRRISVDLLKSECGSALPMVLIFAVTGLIIVSSFLYFHLSSLKIPVHSLTAAQALFNARSGIYKGFHELTHPKDTGYVNPLIDATNPSFGKSMFDSSSADSLSDSVNIDNKLTLDGGSVMYSLYSRDSSDTAEVEMVSEGGSCVLKSTGRYKNVTMKIEAVLGSRIPVHPDTVAICYNINEWDAPGIRGTKTSRADSLADSVSPWLRTLISSNQETLSESDTGLEPPLTIQSNRDLAKIPRVVNGDLLIDGSFHSLTWKDTGTYVVVGRMDISIDVYIEGIKFVVGGEITLSGKSRMNQVSLFSQSKIFIGDDSRFSGNALALNSVAIYGNAAVENKSTIIVSGSSKTDTSSSGTQKDTKPKKIYSIEIGDKAIVDGVLVALGSPGDIKTHEGVTVTGVMIAQKEIGHLGKMAGFMSAGRFIDPETNLETPLTAGGTDTASVKSFINVVRGELEPLSTIDEYKQPFFIGKLTIVKWREF